MIQVFSNLAVLPDRERVVVQGRLSPHEEWNMVFSTDGDVGTYDYMLMIEMAMKMSPDQWEITSANGRSYMIIYKDMPSPLDMNVHDKYTCNQGEGIRQ